MLSVQPSRFRTISTLLAVPALVAVVAGCAHNRPHPRMGSAAVSAQTAPIEGEMVLLTDEELCELRRLEPPRMVWDIAETWRIILAEGDGRWPQPPQPKPVAMSELGDTTDGVKGTIKASGDGVKGETYPNAFDNKLSKWCIKARTIWIQFQYPGGAKHRVRAYSITTANDVPGRDPKDWTLLGSNDGKAWTEIDSRSNEKWAERHQRRVFEVKSPGEYSIYKLDVTKNHGADMSQLSEVELLAPTK